jgi:hypothetical protein
MPWRALNNEHPFFILNCAELTIQFIEFSRSLSLILVENITYLCTKVNIENDTTALSGGCYKQMKNGHELELCVCESAVGATPCNSAITCQHLNQFILLTLTSVILAVHFLSAREK